MTTPPKPTSDEVLEALGRAGHLMEQSVATELANLRFRTITNKPFTDPDEGKSRELEVWAYRNVFRDEDRRVTVGCWLLVECKNTAAPFAFLTRPSDLLRRGAPEKFHFTRPDHEEPYVEEGTT